MIKKITDYLKASPKLYELFRYLVAGVLSTLVSLFTYYLICFIMAEKPTNSLNIINYILSSINSATTIQISIASTLAWIISTFFAYWINLVMVFRIKYKDTKNKFITFFQFVLSRLSTFLLFEQAFLLFLHNIGVSNIISRLIVLIFVMVANYVVSKLWIFTKK